jgi:hypothetical protein
VLYVFGFDRLGIVVSDLYFLDPNPGPGQEGAERGVRLELRYLGSEQHEGSIYAARPIVVGRPLWRVDLLESAENPGTLDRAHHHPSMRGWEPGSRRFEPELTADPLGWLARQLENPGELVDGSQVDVGEIGGDLAQLRRASDEILRTVRELFERIGSGELASAPEGAETATMIRAGWL